MERNAAPIASVTSARSRNQRAEHAQPLYAANRVRFCLGDAGADIGHLQAADVHAQQ